MRIRTGYSFRNAAGMIGEVMDRLEEINLGVAPITDRASAFGWVRWSKLAKERGLRPIFGVELAVTENRMAKKPVFDHWTFFPKDDLEALNLLIELATAQFRYEPCLSYEQAMKFPGFKIAGHTARLDAFEPDQDTFLGLSPAVSRGHLKRAIEKGLQLMAVSDNRYPNAGDRDFYEVVTGRNSSTQSYPQHILSDEEWIDATEHVATSDQQMDALKNRTVISNGSTAGLVVGELLVPEHPATLLEMCEEGAKKLNVDLSDPVYKERLDRELGLIEEKKFGDYFYIISDLVKFAREEMIVGPARGSSCGSLVCYLLEITTVDPIPFGLIFERFIDINRDDLPDIDIDFSDQKRDLVFKYMEDKYGVDRVARLGTVALYKPRSALQETGAALRIPRWETDGALESLIERSGGDSRALDALEDTLKMTPKGRQFLEKYPESMVATRMEGHPRHSSQHAAGVLLTEHPVTHYLPVDARTKATMCDKKDAEALDLLKIDALGLTQLSIFEDALLLAGLPHDHLEGVPLDDLDAFEVLNKRHYSGIFQFNGVALQSLCNQTKITEFEDIVAITALARPGPLTSGGATEWVDRKNGAEVTYPHELFAPYMKDTLGVVMYQEQVMEIGRQIGDLSWADVTQLRKAMSKSLGKEYFDQFGDRWKSAAAAKGIPDDVLEKVWDDLCAYGAWAFNKSHSVAYGLISYWCCWLKARYPIEFAAATLTHTSDPATQISILRELKDEGIGYVAVDVDQSEDRWKPGTVDGQKVVIGPVQNVKGIGPKLTAEIMEARREGRPLPSRAVKLLSDPKTAISSLWPVRDRVIEVTDGGLKNRNIVTKPTPIEAIDENHTTDMEFLVVGTAHTIQPRDENDPIAVAKRGGKVYTRGPTDSLSIQIRDDTGIIYAKINRYNFKDMGKPIVDRGRPGKSLYAFKGTALAGRRFLFINQVRYLGDMEKDAE